MGTARRAPRLARRASKVGLCARRLCTYFLDGTLPFGFSPPWRHIKRPLGEDTASLATTTDDRQGGGFPDSRLPQFAGSLIGIHASGCCRPRTRCPLFRDGLLWISRQPDQRRFLSSLLGQAHDVSPLRHIRGMRRHNVDQQAGGPRISRDLETLHSGGALFDRHGIVERLRPEPQHLTNRPRQQTTTALFCLAPFDPGDGHARGHPK